MSSEHDTPVVDADVVEEIGAPEARALMVRQGSTELIRAGSPAELVERAVEMATELDKIIRKQGMRTKIGRRKVVRENGTEAWEDSFHTNVEAWQTLATFLGLAVVPGEPEPIRDDQGNIRLASYEVAKEFYPKGTRAAQIRDGSAQPERVERATVEGAEGFICRTLVYKDGIIVGAGSSRCTRLEEAWRSRPDFALEGMAQTRSIGRAIATPGRWIVTLAGYSGTPAEEMPPQQQEEELEQSPRFGPPASGELLEKAEMALGYMLGVDRGDEAVKAVLRVVYQRSGGYYPEMALGAVCWAAGQLLKMRQASQPEGTASDDVARAECLAAAAKADPGSLPAPMLKGVSEGEDTQLLRDAGCVCKHPLRSDERDPSCPLKGHGDPRVV